MYFHRAILDSIIDKDTERCRVMMTQHIDDTYNHMLSQAESVDKKVDSSSAENHVDGL